VGLAYDPFGVEGIGDGGLNAGIPEGVPVLLAAHRPIYPYEAREDGIEGRVVVRAFVGTDGRVSQTIVLSGPEALREAATRAVLGSRFHPAHDRGRPVAVWVVLPVEFVLRP
jgi:protein TonB